MPSNFFLIIHILTTARGYQQFFHHDFNKNHAFFPHSFTCLSTFPFLSLFKTSLCCFHTAAGRQAQSITQTSSGNLTRPLSLEPSCQQPAQALWCSEMLANVGCWALRDAPKLTWIYSCWVSTTSQAWRFSVGIMVIICGLPVAKAEFTPLQFTAIIFSHNHNSICGVGAFTVLLHRNPSFQKSHFTLSHCFLG